MIESLHAIRSLGLPPVMEDLDFGRPVPADLRIYMSYPSEFRGAPLDAWRPLTEGGQIPLVDDANLSEICLYDPSHGTFLVKSIEEPEDAAHVPFVAAVPCVPAAGDRRFRAWRRGARQNRAGARVPAHAALACIAAGDGHTARPGYRRANGTVHRELRRATMT